MVLGMGLCSSIVLWHDSHRPELPEVVIKGKGPLDPESCHHHPTDTVRKTPALIVVASKGVPGLLDIVGQYPYDVGNLLGEEARPQPERPQKLPADFRQG